MEIPRMRLKPVRVGSTAKVSLLVKIRSPECVTALLAHLPSLPAVYIPVKPGL